MLMLRPAAPARALLIILWLGAASAAAGQTANGDPVAVPDSPQAAPAAAAAGQELDHEALREMRRVYERAVNEGRIDLLAPLLHEDFHAVMILGDHVSGVDDLRAFWQRIRGLIGEGGRYTTTMKPELSVILGEVALARGTTDDVVVTGEGREYRFSTSWMAVLQRDAGRWKVLRAQGTMDPVGNAFVRDFLRRAGIQGAAIGVVAGIVLGWLFAVLFRRIRSRSAQGG
jgi:ketosteroid isomerase-like protein